jgi:hypothetical protein
MLWWFEREGVKTRVEVLHLASGEYELHVTAGDGADHVETFRDPIELAQRQQEIQDRLRSQGWKGPASWIV